MVDVVQRFADQRGTGRPALTAGRHGKLDQSPGEPLEELAKRVGRQHALDGVDIEETASWRNRAGRANRTMTVESVPLRGELDRTLRPYQKEGVNWLRFLERNGFCGLLADEKPVESAAKTRQMISIFAKDGNKAPMQAARTFPRR